MQSLRVVVRQIGIPNKAAEIYSVAEVTEYIEYQYLSQGYTIQNSHYLGEVKSPRGEIQGYKMMFILTKNESGLSGDVGEKQDFSNFTSPETPAKRGRPLTKKGV